MRVSVITINRNNAEGLQKTIRSVLSQTYPHVEYIVIDGASTDNSVEVIKAHAKNIDYWVSEPDKGLYNAMNKGLAKASGDYVMFLNSADYFHDDGVLAALMEGAAGEDIIYGNLCTLQKGKLQTLKSAARIHYHEKYQHNIPPHPAVLIKRDLVKAAGGFVESYKIIADVVLIARLFSDKRRTYKYVDLPVTIFDMNGVSSSKENQERIYSERRKFIESEFPAYLKDFEKAYAGDNFLKRLLKKII